MANVSPVKILDGITRDRIKQSFRESEMRYEKMQEEGGGEGE